MKGLLLALLSVLALPAPSETGMITVTVSDVKPGKGNVIVALFKDEKSFLVTPAISESKSAATGTLSYSFRAPYGKYGISVFHDQNGNGKLDKNWTGIPVEPIGFGNNYKPFGPPSFEKSAVQFTSQSAAAAIRLYTIL